MCSFHNNGRFYDKSFSIWYEIILKQSKKVLNFIGLTKCWDIKLLNFK